MFRERNTFTFLSFATWGPSTKRVAFELSNTINVNGAPCDEPT